MTSTRLRFWIQKYGDVGILMVSCYLLVRYCRAHWHRLAICLACIFAVALACRSRRHPASYLRVVSRVAPVSTIMLPSNFQKARLSKQMQVQAEGNTWRFEIWDEENNCKYPDFPAQYLKVFRNAKLVRTTVAGELGGYSLEFGKVAFAYHLPLIVIRANPMCGNPGSVSLFTIRNRQFYRIAQIGGENGGPLLRDYDGDGRREWVFDDYCWYEYYNAGPKWLRIYKEGKDGRLTFWKRLPNRRRRHLAENLGFERWDQ